MNMDNHDHLIDPMLQDLWTFLLRLDHGKPENWNTCCGLFEEIWKNGRIERKERTQKGQRKKEEEVKKVLQKNWPHKWWCLLFKQYCPTPQAEVPQKQDEPRTGDVPSTTEQFSNAEAPQTLSSDTQYKPSPPPPLLPQVDVPQVQSWLFVIAPLPCAHLGSAAQ